MSQNPAAPSKKKTTKKAKSANPQAKEQEKPLEANDWNEVIAAQQAAEKSVTNSISNITSTIKK